MRCLRLLLLLIVVVAKGRAQQLVMPGDHPDPSVVKIGDTYWASATTSNWFPAYPLMKSKDLVNWTTVGHVFNQLPAWADYYFWAPEISYENGKVYVYYSAHQKNGNLCLGVASADKPEGPYKDHGPLMCQPAGSIDAFPMRDEYGKLYLIWKEDGNSVGQPTPIWAMEMNEERTKLIGEKKQLFRNDAAWEGNLVEGLSMIRKGEYFYAFYAGAACCGRGCNYAMGVARSKNLLGPWEKYSHNPIKIENQRWKCPGHGTPVEKDGRYYFLYHAYDTSTNVYTGRQGVLSEFRFGGNDWIEFVNEPIPSNVSLIKPIVDKFKGSNLSHNWQWSVFQPVKYQLKKGCLELTSISSAPVTYLGQKTYSGNYYAATNIITKNSDAGTGIGAIGDDENMVYAIYRNDTLQLIVRKEGRDVVVASKQIKAKFGLRLSMEVENGKDIYFRYAMHKITPLLYDHPIDGSFLPPWDRAVRVGLVVKGPPGSKGLFEEFEMYTR